MSCRKMPLLPRPWLVPVMFSGTHHSICNWKFSNFCFVRMSPFFLSTVKTPSFTIHSAGPPLAFCQAERSFPSNRTMASEGALFVLMSPGVTTFGCGVQYSDIPGFIFSCSGYCFCALALTQAVQANAAKAVFIVMLLFMV